MPFQEAAHAELGDPPEGVSQWNWYGQSTVWKKYDPSEAEPIIGWLTLSQLLYRSGYTIILLTAREDNDFKREQCTRWFEKVGLEYDLLVMWQKDCDYDEFKRIATKKLSMQYKIVLAIDDHEAHCEAYRSHSIPFLHAHPDAIR